MKQHQITAAKRQMPPRVRKYLDRELSDSELLTVVLSMSESTARKLLGRVGGLDGVRRSSIEVLTNHRGIGLTTAARLKALAELTDRFIDARTEQKPQGYTSIASVALHARERHAVRGEDVLACYYFSRHQILRYQMGIAERAIYLERHLRDITRPALLYDTERVVLALCSHDGNPQIKETYFSFMSGMFPTFRVLGISIKMVLVGAENFWEVPWGRKDEQQ